MSVLNFLKKIDQFGRDVKFNIDSDDVFRTYIGGILSILFWLTIIFIAGYFGQDIIKREKPKFLFEISKVKEAPYFQLNSTNFFFAIRIEDSLGTNFDNPRFFDFKYEAIKYIRLNTTKSSFDKKSSGPVYIGKCNSSHIKKETLQKYNLNEYNCAYINSSLGGYFDTEITYQMKYFIGRCSKH